MLIYWGLILLWLFSPNQKISNSLNMFTVTLAKNISELQQPTQATTPFALKIWKEHFCWNNLSYWICTMLVYLPSITSHIGIINIYMGIGRTEVFGMSDDEEASKRCWATLSDFVTALLSTESMQCSAVRIVVMSWICLKGHVKTKECIDIASTPIYNNNFILSELLTNILRMYSLFKSFQLFDVAVQFCENNQQVNKIWNMEFRKKVI